MYYNRVTIQRLKITKQRKEKKKKQHGALAHGDINTVIGTPGTKQKNNLLQREY